MSILNTFPGNPGIATSEKDGLMSKFDKEKLDTVDKNANFYAHPDSHPASMILESSSRKFVTAEEKQKINTPIENSTQTTDGLMSKKDKTKLDGIETNANNYVHPVNHPASIIVQSASYRFVTDAEKTTWNAKAEKTVASTTTDGLMSKTDKTKLDGIANNANNYTHPANHAATMITEDTAHRFVTDAEKTTWNSKANTTVATTDDDGLMSILDKSKLDGIEEGANKYVHPSTHTASIITQDTTHRFVTDAEKSTWNSKASTTIATTAADGLMSKTDKSKLDGIAINANNYTHPTSHAATMITEDTTHRFVTDIEKTTWNSKANTTVATATANGLMVAADKKKLDSIATGANNYVHPSTHAATIITQDATHRFVSDAEKASWNNKPDNKSDIGLGNVTNDAQVKRSEMGVANGVATLDTNGKVLANQLPSFVDDVLEFDTLSVFPDTGEEGKIYIDISTNKTYRWSGTQYTIIGNDLALGETSSTAYPGNKGKSITDEVNKIKAGTTVVPKAADAATVSSFTVGTNVPANAKFTDTVYTHPANHAATMITEDTTHRFVTDTEKSTWNAKASTVAVTTTANGLMTKEDKVKLNGIATGANNYTHPSSHDASIIVQSSSYRFVSDAEKTTWNAKASTAIATTAADGLMSKADKTKLDGIATGANNYTHPANHAATMITTDTTHRFVTDAEKTTWNGKASTAVVTTTANGLMIAADKVKLDGIATGANNYTHPSTHAASIITQDSTHRFVSDTEKTTWNGKASSSHTHTSLVISDTRSTNPAPNDSTLLKKAVSFDFKSNSAINSSPAAGSYSGVMNVVPWTDQSGGNAYQMLFGYGDSATTPVLAIRTNTLNSTSWGSWYEVYTTANKPTLTELGAAAASHTHVSTAVTQDATHRFVSDTQISTWNAKASTAIATQSANGLMSSTDKKKLDGIATGANNYTHPTTHAATMITEDTTHRFVTDTEKSTWNAKASTAVVTTTANGLMTKEDKVKLNGIATGANNYTHPSSHAATMITTDTTHRFVTDTQITTWNNKAGTTVASTTTNGLMSSTDKNTLNSLSSKVQTLETNYAAMLAKLKTAVFIG